MKIARSVKVKASAENAWQVIGPSFAEVDRWASNVYVSTSRAGQTKPGAPAAGRNCETSQGTFREEIVEYDEDRKCIRYSVQGDNVPGFVRSIVASWTIRPNGANNCVADMEMNAVIAPPFNFLMGWLMKQNFGKAIDESLEEFKYYLETGNIHSRKAKVEKSKKATASPNSMSSKRSS